MNDLVQTNPDKMPVINGRLVKRLMMHTCKCGMQYCYACVTSDDIVYPVGSQKCMLCGAPRE